MFQKLPLCAVAARVVSVLGSPAALPLTLRGCGGVFFIIKTPKLLYLLFCGALVVIAVLWIPWEGPGAAAAYSTVEHYF